MKEILKALLRSFERLNPTQKNLSPASFCGNPPVYITSFSDNWNKLALKYAKEQLNYINQDLKDSTTEEPFLERNIVILSIPNKKIDTNTWNEMALAYAREKDLELIKSEVIE